MVRLVIFLRAINVGGHNVKMDQLRRLVAGYGFDAVETFIASGNVIVDRGRRRTATVEKLLEAGLAADLGYPVACFARTTAELADVVAAEPFAGAAGRYYVTFLKEAPTASSRDRLLALRSEIDDLAVVGRELHWLVREGFESQLTGAEFERTAAGPGTSRNITTVRKLAAKYPP
ncbi:MAG: DUF1697 domain-containing protein [Actinomycetota bacterium]|nr:DUF1697 domain-containing protein [Actinomycetota bacterium]